LLSELWLNSGMCIGVHTALGQYDDLFDQVTVEVDFPSLSFSADLAQLLESEIGALASQLEEITRNLVFLALARLTS
jgi:hypothetical protein